MRWKASQVGQSLCSLRGVMCSIGLQFSKSDACAMLGEVAFWFSEWAARYVLEKDTIRAK